MEFQELIEKRYSCRKFSDKKVDKELIKKIIEAGRIAPTAVNTQPFKIFWFTSDKAKEVIQNVCNYTFGADNFLLVGYKEEEGWQRTFDQRNFADIDASIAATHMMLAIEELGLSTTWVGCFDAPMLQTQFPEMKGYHLIALFPIGYAADNSTPSERHFKRKETKQILEIL
ncbi:nitroreductase family protein [Faecalimonas sp.]